MLYRATRRVQVDQREFEPGDRVTFAEGREHLAEELLKLGAAEVSRGGAGTEGAAAPTEKASEQPAVPPAAGRRTHRARKTAEAQ